MTIWDKTLQAFVDDVASSSPTPGGGSVSLVSAVLGAGLIAMAISISLKGKAGEAHGTELTKTLETIEHLRGQLIAKSDADIAAFGQFMDAYRLPKDSVELQRVRDRTLAEAAQVACNVPISAAQIVCRCLELAMDVRPLVSKMIVSDIDAGVLLLRGAGLAVLLNVDANLSWLSPEAREAAISDAETTKAEILAFESRVRV